MAIKIGQQFQRTGGFPIDESLVLTKAEMLAMQDAFMPDKYFALCSDDNKMYYYDKSVTPSAETGKFIELIGGSGGDNTLDENYTTNAEVGGLKEGTDLKATDTIQSVLKRMLVTTYYPVYTAPSASLTVPNTLAEVGTTITQNIVLAFNAGAITLRGTKQADRAGTATNYNVKTTGADTNYNEDKTSGTFSDVAISRATRGNVVVSGVVSYAEGAQPKDSDGKDFETPLSAGDVSAASKTIEFIYPFIWGASDSATPDLSTLTKDLSKKGNKTYSYTTANQYIVFAYDKSYGDLSSILDQNGFETISGYTKTVDGEYNVYVSDTPTTDTNAANTFKF